MQPSGWHQGERGVHENVEVSAQLSVGLAIPQILKKEKPQDKWLAQIKIKNKVPCGKRKTFTKKRVSKSRKQRDTQEAQAASQSSALLCSRDEGPWWGQAGRQSEGRVQNLSI